MCEWMNACMHAGASWLVRVATGPMCAATATMKQRTTAWRPLLWLTWCAWSAENSRHLQVSHALRHHSSHPVSNCAYHLFCTMHNICCTWNISTGSAVFCGTQQTHPACYCCICWVPHKTALPVLMIYVEQMLFLLLGCLRLPICSKMRLSTLLSSQSVMTPL